MFFKNVLREKREKSDLLDKQSAIISKKTKVVRTCSIFQNVPSYKVGMVVILLF